MKVSETDVSDPYAYPPIDYERSRPRLRADTAAATVTGGSVKGGHLAGLSALLTLATGAAALGFMAIGALAIGRLVVGEARFKRLEIDELVVRKLTLLDNDKH